MFHLCVCVFLCFSFSLLAFSSFLPIIALYVVKSFHAFTRTPCLQFQVFGGCVRLRRYASNAACTTGTHTHIGKPVHTVILCPRSSQASASASCQHSTKLSFVLNRSRLFTVSSLTNTNTLPFGNVMAFL